MAYQVVQISYKEEIMKKHTIVLIVLLVLSIMCFTGCDTLMSILTTPVQVHIDPSVLTPDDPDAHNTPAPHYTDPHHK